jgi:hypothetical protein
LVEAVIDEVAVEEVAAWRLELTLTRSSAVRERRRSKSIWPPQRRLAGNKDSGGVRGR